MQVAASLVRTAVWPVVTRATPDAELAERAAGGDDRAFEAIMRRHNRLLFRSARSILRSDAESEDALQEAYVRAWRALASFRADSKLSTWLVRIVINEALGRLRRRGATVYRWRQRWTTAMHRPKTRSPAMTSSNPTGLRCVAKSAA